jgi:DNA polymerase III subunit epsilon
MCSLAMREIIFDTETTGLSPGNGDRLVEIGCIELINRVETGNVFHAYFNPERPMPPEAQAVHGLSDSFLADKPLFATRVEALIAYFGTDARLVAHNAAFDFGFVDAELVRVGHPPLDRSRMVDTIAIARRIHPGAKHSLDALCVRYGIDRSHRVKHGALLDAELLAQLYIELTGGRQIGLELAADSGPAAGDEMILAGARSVRRPFVAPRPHSASVMELERHRIFVGQMASPLWHDTP